MKRILYSNPLKFFSVLLCAACAALSVQLFMSNFLSYDTVYMFENSYEDSYTAGNELAMEFYSLYNQLENTMDRTVVEDDRTDEVNSEELQEVEDKPGRLRPEKLINLPVQEEWEYYIKVNNKVYTNVKNADYNYFEQSKLAFGIQSHKNGIREAFRKGATTHSYWFLDAEDDYEICVKMPDKRVAENTVAWEQVKERADGAAGIIIVLLIVFVALLIYLLTVCGKSNGEIRLMLIDRMYVEITSAMFLTAAIGGVTLVVVAACTAFDEHMVMAYPLVSLLTFGVTAVSIALLLSLIRNIKNRSFLEKSLIAKTVKFLWKCVKKIFNGIKNMLKNSKSIILSASASHFDGRFVGILIVSFAMAVCILTVLCLASPVFVIFLAAFVIAAVVFVSKRIIGFDKLKQGIAEIKNGDLSHKIEGCPEGVIGKMAEDINSIGEGLQKSLQREVKAERMKSELITNVSHDLKTPLTSIINYTDLLSKEKLTPEEANDYVAIISKKSERLKQLTEDLFDISKAQSGNEEFNIEEIDLCLLIEQALAEQNSAITKSGLDFRFSHEKDIFVMADGRKMSRVFENLIVNCVKYAMKNTRVYIDIHDAGDKAIVEVKNISRYEMDFDESEITERFVRGDSARSSEGSGLGLAIVKSYVEGCNGTVNISKDGDLFKVSIILNK